MKRLLPRLLLIAPLCLLSWETSAKEITVMISGGFKAAWEKLSPAFAAEKGYTIKTVPGPSMGQSPEAIPNRLAAGEKADVIIMVGYALDKLDKEGRLLPGTRTELADSKIGAVVKKGAAVPDITTANALRATLLKAHSVAYSDSASGKYVETTLFNKLGIAEQLKPKAKRVEKTPVAQSVASGRYEIGFQQVSELLPVAGVTFIGKLPEDMQYVTRFAGAVSNHSAQPEKAKALLAYLSSPGVQQQIQATGLDPVSGRAPAPQPRLSQ